jgi:cytochrome c553
MIPISLVLMASAGAVSESTEACLMCHRTAQPGLVEDWLASRHAQTTPAVALQQPVLERRLSAESVPEPLSQVAVGCYECHGWNADQHPDSFDHMGTRIHTVVTPEDCRTCHPAEVQQFRGTKKAQAFHNLQDNPLYRTLVETLTRPLQAEAGRLKLLEPSANAQHESCYSCHGTRVEVAGMKTVSTAYGDLEVPHLTFWPNQGVGRVNPDGSTGSCSACHARHGFSVELARKPETCGQCHLEPDVPAYNVYKESKHGNLVESLGHGWNWNAVPWVVGRDFRAPTCATCHNSLLTRPDGEVVVNRTHDFGARLWVRLFGLIYSHPQPQKGDTTLLRNADGLPLPTTFDGVPARGFLLDAAEQQRRRQEMSGICVTCHSTSWTQGHFAKLDRTLVETDQMVGAATQWVAHAWQNGWADRSNPFDEPIEQKWIRQWLFYANSVRYASAMTGAPDYAAFKNGWWSLTENLREMEEWLRLFRR